MKIDLAKFQAVLLDLDGTLYHEDHPLPGAADLLLRLQRDNVKYACISNATTSPARLVTRLANMGVAVPADKIYTASASAVDHVLARFGAGGRTPRVFNLATDGIHEMLSGRVAWVQGEGEPCDAVIIGAPSNAFATEDRCRLALRILRNGAAVVGICADRVYPSARGLEFGSGSLTTMMTYAANVKPFFCGKPQAAFFNELCRRLETSAPQCVLIGDNLESDIAGARALGMKTILTLTGVARRSDLKTAPPEMQPDEVIEDLREFLAFAFSI